MARSWISTRNSIVEGERLAVEDPAATIGEGGGEDGKEAVALFVPETLDVERLNGCTVSAARLPSGCSSEDGS
jgi:hypothetical protein